MGIRAPYTLKNFNLYVDGISYAGIVDEGTLPKITVKAEEHRAGGMDTPMSIDLGIDKLEISFTLAEMNPEVMSFVGVHNGGTTNLVFRGAANDDSSPGATRPIVATCRGTFTESDSGNWKNGDKTQQKITGNLRYYKLEVDGKLVYEIDVENMIRNVGGTDQLESIRAAIGL